MARRPIRTTCRPGGRRSTSSVAVESAFTGSSHTWSHVLYEGTVSRSKLERKAGAAQRDRYAGLPSFVNRFGCGTSPPVRRGRRPGISRLHQRERPNHVQVRHSTYFHRQEIATRYGHRSIRSGRERLSSKGPKRRRSTVSAEEHSERARNRPSPCEPAGDPARLGDIKSERQLPQPPLQIALGGASAGRRFFAGRADNVIPANIFRY
jgi:hypothetical protein